MKKTCTKCKKTKPEEEFFWKKKNVKRHTFCKECYKEVRKTTYRKHYEKNRTRYLERAKENKNKHKETCYEKIVDYLLKNPCLCGESDPIVLEFHHKDRKEKEDNISAMVSSGQKWDKIEKEINKCVVLCSNCHKRITAKEQNSCKYRVCVAKLV